MRPWKQGQRAGQGSEKMLPPGTEGTHLFEASPRPCFSRLSSWSATRQGGRAQSRLGPIHLLSLVRLQISLNKKVLKISSANIPKPPRPWLMRQVTGQVRGGKRLGQQ